MESRLKARQDAVKAEIAKEVEVFFGGALWCLRLISTAHELTLLKLLKVLGDAAPTSTGDFRVPWPLEIAQSIDKLLRSPRVERTWVSMQLAASRGHSASKFTVCGLLSVAKDGKETAKGGCAIQ